MLRLQLQRFAEKTERATPQRRREARQEGRIPKSAELTSAAALVAVLVALRILGPQMWQTWLDAMQNGLSRAASVQLTPGSLHGVFQEYLWEFLRLLGPLVAVALVVGVGTAYAQVGPVFLPKLLTPDFNRVQPFAGLRRMLSVRSVIEAVKALLKLSIIGGVAYLVLHGVVIRLQELMTTDILAMPAIVGGIVFQLAIGIAASMLALAVLDYLFQRFEFERSIRMSREEIKEELKRHEGDPQVRMRIRQRGRALAIRRMMQEVPKADVVVTNPTHYAVALRYDAARMSAPLVVAKGVDELAWRIRQIADDAGVPRVENRPLAQSLYRQVELGDPIPPELFQAVAEVLAYVYRLRQADPARR